MRREQRKRKKSSSPAAAPQIDQRNVPRPPARADAHERRGDDPWEIRYFRRHPDDDPARSAPGRDFLTSCPVKVRANIRNVLEAVAKAPPTRFAGGGKWEATHGLQGVYEVRVRQSQTLFRLFCVLDYSPGLRSVLAVIDGASKPNRTELSEAEYERVRRYAAEYRGRDPRSYC